MSRLQWTRVGDTWSAGRYSIELAAPQHWVLTVAGHEEAISSIAATSGSLKALMADADVLEHRRKLGQRRLRYLGYSLVAALVLIVATNAGHAWAPVIVPPSAGFLVWALIRLVDTSVARSWEFVSGVYQ